MSDGRFRNHNWNLAGTDGAIGTWEKVGIAVLMDIRDELQTLNGILKCPNFTGMPASLRRIARNTAKRRRPAKKRRAR